MLQRICEWFLTSGEERRREERGEGRGERGEGRGRWWVVRLLVSGLHTAWAYILHLQYIFQVYKLFPKAITMLFCLM